MSKEYDDYLVQHKANVGKAFDWFKEFLPNLFWDMPGVDLEWQIKLAHDESKTTLEEYYAYDAYFYGNNNTSEKVVEAFQQAWLLHIHRNPHHWQYWVLINDDPGEGLIAKQMPYHYMIEMICDWWSFSWSSGDLTIIFAWYEERKEYMKLNKWTRALVESILFKIKDKLEETEND